MFIEGIEGFNDHLRPARSSNSVEGRKGPIFVVKVFYDYRRPIRTRKTSKSIEGFAAYLRPIRSSKSVESR